MVSIRPKRGTNRILLDIPNHLQRNRYALEKSLYDIGSEVVKETARLIRKGKRTGRMYKYKKRNLRASAPGEPPRNRSGRLARSGDFRVRNWAEMEVGQEADYAVFLAKGTKNMEPRPSMVTAINNKSRDMEVTLLENLQESINDK
jgi:hypothetical protein